MIKFFLFTIVTLSFMVSCSGPKALPRPESTVGADGSRVLNGYLNRSMIEQDTSFPWFAANMKFGTADAAAIRSFATKKDLFTMLVFGGTWCHDTQNLLPVFYRLLDKSGYPESRVTLVGVNEQKQDKMNLYRKWNIVNVPTFIVLDAQGRERGRVVEYGTLNSIDKELGTIVAAL